jgi:hypothetical protein
VAPISIGGQLAPSLPSAFNSGRVTAPPTPTPPRSAAASQPTGRTSAPRHPPSRCAAARRSDTRGAESREPPCARPRHHVRPRRVHVSPQKRGTPSSRVRCTCAVRASPSPHVRRARVPVTARTPCARPHHRTYTQLLAARAARRRLEPYPRRAVSGGTPSSTPALADHPPAAPPPSTAPRRVAQMQGELSRERHAVPDAARRRLAAVSPPCRWWRRPLRTSRLSRAVAGGIVRCISPRFLDVRKSRWRDASSATRRISALFSRDA